MPLRGSCDCCANQCSRCSKSAVIWVALDTPDHDSRLTQCTAADPVQLDCRHRPSTWDGRRTTQTVYVLIARGSKGDFSQVLEPTQSSSKLGHALAVQRMHEHSHVPRATEFASNDSVNLHQHADSGTTIA